MEIFKKTSFWILSCVIMYSVGILLFWTIDSLFNKSADYISAFGSLLSAIGTFFAAFMALHVFNGWKTTENHKTKNGHINNAVNSYLQLQEFLKSKTIPLRNTHLTLQVQSFTPENRISLMLDLNEIQVEILYILRAFQTHIQLFTTIHNKLTLCGNFEQVINDVSTQAKNRLDILLRDLEYNPQSQILLSFDDYQKYITGQLLTDLHLKIIIKLTEESKAL